jgi:hypothetical protein
MLRSRKRPRSRERDRDRDLACVSSARLSALERRDAAQARLDPSCLWVSSGAEASLDPSSLWVSSGPTSREQAEREGCSRGVAGFEREVRTSGVVGGEGQLALTDDFARNRALRWERQVNAGKSKQGPKGGHTASHARSEGMGGVRAWEGGVRAWEGMGGVRAWVE